MTKKMPYLQLWQGQGGKEAEDWAYASSHVSRNYFEEKGRLLKTSILNELLGRENEVAKSIETLEVKGKHAYGYLRREAGVHRLVRLSPFSAQNLRHTSFALVDVIPVIKEADNIEIKSEGFKG